jgi:hypothetical protein
MDNSAATPRINPVSIPPDWCPKGNWAHVFTEYQKLFLAAAGVEIPGFGAVTPATLAQLQADILSLQEEVESINSTFTKAYRNGAGTLVASQTPQDVAITFASPMPSTDYDIGAVILSSGSTNASQSWHLAGAKSVNGFSLKFNGTTSYTSFEWWARER